MSLLKKMLLILGLLTGAQAFANFIPATITSDLDAESRRLIVRLDGPIVEPSYEELKKALDAVPADFEILLELHSPGGSRQEGMQIIDLLREQKKSHLLTTRVRNGERCASMCVPLFLEGNKKIAGESAAFMFHGVTPDPLISNIPKLNATREFLDLLRSQGVSPTWLQSLIDKGVFSKPGEFWRTGSDLAREKAGVINFLIDSHVEYEPYEAPFDPQIRPR